MRITTWNVNGIKTLPQFFPWNRYNSEPFPFEGILDALGADIACFQETKIVQKGVDRGLACLPSYDAFFSSYSRHPPRGYSGTVTYTRRAACVPRKAEEGLTGLLQREVKDLKPSDQIGSYPSILESDYSQVELRDLDAEGRATVLDLGLFVLFNLYCPNQTNDARLEFKNAYNATLDARIRALIRDGREVMVVGDMNICPQEIDHCEPQKRAEDHGLDHFTDHPARRWFNNLTGVNGILIDVCRYYHPRRQGMFTCWETKISARDTNFGTRLDYILVTPGLMPWISFSDIQADIKGSDHCPVYVDLKDELVGEDGSVKKLWDVVNPPDRVALDEVGRAAFAPPRFAARNYPIFSTKQLTSFFSRKNAALATGAALSLVDPTPSPPEGTIDAAIAALHRAAPVEVTPTPPPISPTLRPAASISKENESISLALAGLANARPPKAPSAEPTSKRVPSQNRKRNGMSPEGQKTISSWFSKPAPASSHTAPLIAKPRSKERSESPPVDLDGYVDDADDSQANVAIVKNATAWNAMFKKPDAPLCKGHGEPCKEWTVNKSGANKGRKFWLCARPVGEGYERSGVKKEDVNPKYRCDHFAWATSVKRPSSTADAGSTKKARTD